MINTFIKKKKKKKTIIISGVNYENYYVYKIYIFTEFCS